MGKVFIKLVFLLSFMITLPSLSGCIIYELIYPPSQLTATPQSFTRVQVDLMTSDIMELTLNAYAAAYDLDGLILDATKHEEEESLLASFTGCITACSEYYNYVGAIYVMNNQVRTEFSTFDETTSCETTAITIDTTVEPTITFTDDESHECGIRVTDDAITLACDDYMMENGIFTGSIFLGGTEAEQIQRTIGTYDPNEDGDLCEINITMNILGEDDENSSQGAATATLFPVEEENEAEYESLVLTYGDNHLVITNSDEEELAEADLPDGTGELSEENTLSCQNVTVTANEDNQVLQFCGFQCSVIADRTTLFNMTYGENSCGFGI